MKSALKRFRKNDAPIESVEVENAEVEKAFKCVKSVSCNQSDLTEFITNPAASLEALNSPDTPLFKLGMDIILSPIVNKNGVSENVSKKAKVSIADVLMKKVILEKSMSFLQWEIDIDLVPEINEQITEKLYSLFEEIDLGYCDPDQKNKLETNAGHLNGTLCFVQKFWKVLFRAEFPRIPDGDEEFASSKLLTALCTTTRKKQQE